MFTVEQVEYVRRIRTSGLTRDQVLAIWDRLDRIDVEFSQQVLSSTLPQFVSPSAATSTPQISREFMQLLQQERTQQANALMMLQMQQILTSANKPNANPKGQQVEPLALSVESENNNHQALSAQNTSDGSNKSEPIDTPNLEVPARLVDENDPEMLDFLRKNSEPQICEQIRQFIALNGIKQHQVAVLVGTSQSYISKYLKADYLEMSERSRRNIYRWYVTYRNQSARAISDACAVIANPHLQHSISSSTLPSTAPLSLNITPTAASNPVPLFPVSTTETNGNHKNTNNGGMVSPGIANAPGSPRSTSSSSGGGNAASSNAHNWSTSANNNASQMSAHRRFRFTFRAQQLAILERAFSEDTYPTVERREELARQLSVGLESDQAVSLFTVTNWFANRRKEAKRIATEEGLNVEELGMKRGRGRPSILHRMASAQLRETRQNLQSDGAGKDGATGNGEVELRPKRARKIAPGNEEEGAEDLTDDDQSMSSNGDDADDASSASAGQNYRQNSADLAVFPTPEVIAS